MTKEFYIDCFPSDEGARHIPNSNTWVRKISTQEVAAPLNRQGCRWTNGRKKELLPPIDNDDFPKKYVVRVYGDDPRSGCVYCGMETAEKMRDINEDGYWEWLDENNE